MTKSNEKILSVDIGGSSIKAAVLDSNGKIVQKYHKLPTPNPATPDTVLETIKKLAIDFSFDKIAAGFPGYIKNGVVHTAPNLGTDNWAGVNFAKKLGNSFKIPARVINDADMQGLGIINGKGFEMVVTLGTGFGTAFFRNGELLPHLEIGQHPITKNKTYDEYIGKKEFSKIGVKKWNKRVEYILGVLKTTFNYDTLYIGGGNAKKLNFKLDKHIKTVANIDGIDGGARLWQQEDGI